MRSTLLLLILAVLVAFSAAAKVHPAPACVSEGACASHDWRMIHSADPSHQIRVIVPVRLNNMDRLKALVYEELSNPQSAEYGKWFSFDELGRFTRNQAAVDAISAYFTARGVKFAVTPNQDYFVAQMNVSQAESILDTKFHYFYSRVAQQAVVRALEYTIPDELEEHVNLFGDVISFSHTLRPAPLINAHAVDAKASGNVDITLIDSTYSVNSNTVKNTAKATQSLFESGQDYSPTDLSTFESQYNIPASAVTTVVGSNSPLLCNVDVNLCIEANLDVQYIKAVAQGADTTYWSVAGNGDVFLSWILALASDKTAPLVHSISYGSIESEIPATEVNQFDEEALKLGARGITIMVSSGDDGVANYGARSDPSSCGFNPSFPASVSNVVAVGATQGPEDGTAEVMCSSKTGGVVTSGGGFSTVIAQPSYQATAVKNYFNSGVKFPASTAYNKAGRGYPDVALLGHNYLVVIAGKTYQVSGTSCSSPTFAGLVTLVNDARISAGKSSLGLLNTALYQAQASTPSAFNDITVGENNCCAADSNPVCCPSGFYAANGWDATTGLGSVNFNTLLKTLVAN